MKGVMSITSNQEEKPTLRGPLIMLKVVQVLSILPRGRSKTSITTTCMPRPGPAMWHLDLAAITCCRAQSRRLQLVRPRLIRQAYHGISVIASRY